MTLTVLIENTAPEGLIAEHGLSLLIETPRTKFLFDCGHTGAAFDNAKTLGVDLSEIKFVALSHSHYDHAGGFPKLLDFAPVEKIFTGKNFWEEKFSNDTYRGCGFDEKFLSARGIEQIICRDEIELEENVWLVGNFKRRYEFETIPKKFLRVGNVTLHPAGMLSTAQNFQPPPALERHFVPDGNVTLHTAGMLSTAQNFQPPPALERHFVPDGNVTLHPAGMLSTAQNFQPPPALERHFVPDDFSDEIILVLRSGDGLTVVTACAHSGILNIVSDIRERFNLPIRCVIGGLHLTGATPERISRTLNELKLLGVEKILPCHCSGEEFMKLCGEKISTGSVVNIV